MGERLTSRNKMMPVIEEMLLRMKAKQEEEKAFFGNSYKGVGYIYVHEDGTYYNPNYITCEFVKHLKKQGFRRIRFHDLRHSCATLMRHEGIKMEDIQKWLGHRPASNYLETKAFKL